ncbi:hypothetical protein [Desulfuromonas thiophila]|uniref:hypothetical protein n=1 Tax=Desulfuromonas thiophila TaxID=57664 RepID=UPI0024A90997|nr:hypothetical protein [Desulfuromonas thiophila]
MRTEHNPSEDFAQGSAKGSPRRTYCARAIRPLLLVLLLAAISASPALARDGRHDGHPGSRHDNERAGFGPHERPTIGRTACPPPVRVVVQPPPKPRKADVRRLAQRSRRGCATLPVQRHQPRHNAPRVVIFWPW